MIKLGSSDMAKAYVGSTEVSKMYLGGDLVYENNPYDEYGYIKAGKVFHLDGADFDGNTWIDRIGGITYTPEGTVTSQNGGVVLNGSSLLYSSQSADVSNTIGTLEIVYKPNTLSNYQTILFQRSGKFSYFLNTNKTVSWRITSSKVATKITNATTSIYTHSLSNSYNYFNGVSMGNGATVKWQNTSQYPSVIGCYWYNSSYKQYYASGILYQIRIYNRILTEAEILHNQQVDNERYNIGLTIE